jgi:predicted nucleic acid-binding protein
MPTSNSGPEAAVDTSVSIPLVISDHEHHDDVFAALDGRRLAIAGHAAFETYSILTRLPPPVRLTPAAAARILRENFDLGCFLTPDRTQELLLELPSLGVAGGSVYDAVVAAAAKEHALNLVTRDRRAIPTYRQSMCSTRLSIDTG